MATIRTNLDEVLPLVRRRDVAELAERYLRPLIDSAIERGLGGCLSATEDENDGSLFVEWVFPDHRIGMLFDTSATPGDSGWHLISSMKAGNRCYMANLDDFDAERVLRFAADPASEPERS